MNPNMHPIDALVIRLSGYAAAYEAGMAERDEIIRTLRKQLAEAEAKLRELEANADAGSSSA